MKELDPDEAITPLAAMMEQVMSDSIVIANSAYSCGTIMNGRSGRGSKVSVRSCVIAAAAQLVLVAPAFAQLVEVAQVPGDTLSWEIPEQWVYEGSCFYVSAVNGVGLEGVKTKYCLTAADVQNAVPNPPTGLTVVRVAQ